MEGDETRPPERHDAWPEGMIEWVIRLALLSLLVAAVWTVFGDDLTQLLIR